MKQTKSEFWVSADRIMFLTGLNKYQMFKLRKDNPSWWKLIDGKYRYNENAIPQTMLKHETATL